MKIMKSGIEMDAKEQEKIKGGYCVCFCDTGVIARQPEIHGVNGGICVCTCTEEIGSTASYHMSSTYG
ncbi:MAG: hypothetical protein GY950_14630 [bacterium]|nr:hypothetical protein [bacterium]